MATSITGDHKYTTNMATKVDMVPEYMTNIATTVTAVQNIGQIWQSLLLLIMNK